ncbi:MAG: hypothetical protein PHU81_06260 [Acidobacteriota bacterium]|nr:hypothetical protein [Acidobacteriota bacterium]
MGNTAAMIIQSVRRVLGRNIACSLLKKISPGIILIPFPVSPEVALVVGFLACWVSPSPAANHDLGSTIFRITSCGLGGAGLMATTFFDKKAISKK